VTSNVPYPLGVISYYLATPILSPAGVAFYCRQHVWWHAGRRRALTAASREQRRFLSRLLSSGGGGLGDLDLRPRLDDEPTILFLLISCSSLCPINLIQRSAITIISRRRYGRRTAGILQDDGSAGTGALGVPVPVHHRQVFLAHSVFRRNAS
jgi:hypothetical protein